LLTILCQVNNIQLSVMDFARVSARGISSSTTRILIWIDDELNAASV